MEQNLKKLASLHEEHQRLLKDWYRHLLTLSAGALVLLGTLASDTQAEGMIRYLLAATWLCLGLGILTGAGATYMGVSSSDNLLKSYRDEISSSLRERRDTRLLHVGKPNPVFVICTKVMVVSLLLAVVCLTGYSVMATLTV